MDIRVGMFVRTESGKIWRVISSKAIDGHRRRIVNASYNIIDLIEVGDYVNGLQVIEVREHLHNDIEIVLTNGEFNWSFSKNESNYDIKSIVTKEQFEAMEYKVGGMYE